MAVKSCYELLEIAPTASPDEIRHAFRRALARYHPDKVQHLGVEFQDIAAAKTLLPLAVSKLTKAGRKSMVHHRHASRHIGRLSAMVSKLG